MLLYIYIKNNKKSNTYDFDLIPDNITKLRILSNINGIKSEYNYILLSKILNRFKNLVSLEFNNIIVSMIDIDKYFILKYDKIESIIFKGGYIIEFDNFKHILYQANRLKTLHLTKFHKPLNISFNNSIYIKKYINTLFIDDTIETSYDIITSNLVVYVTSNSTDKISKYHKFKLLNIIGYGQEININNFDTDILILNNVKTFIGNKGKYELVFTYNNAMIIEE